MNKIRLTIILTLFAGLCTATYGQTTIGSGKDPMKGALLDLKEYDNNNGGDTAGKGMMLPRVNLINLKPTTPSELATSIGSSGTWDLNAHIGLLVYNVKLCPAGGGIIYDETGPQVWSGSRWQLLSLPAIIEASPAETSGANIWGTSVVKHQAKPNPAYVAGTDPAHLANTYEEFYSADFGSAGRWMTTNLTAWAYDSNSITATLDSQADAATSDVDTRWCYPKIDATVLQGEGAPSTWNSQQGLLYNWPAVTGNQNGSIDDQGDSDHAKIQGLCPTGWHLPSDREWTNLENTILSNHMLYASGSPSAAGQAMKHPCKLLPDHQPPGGLSKFIGNGGFSALMVGFAHEAVTDSYSYEACFWTSSAIDFERAWSRYVFWDGIDLVHYNARRFDLRSLRCKKD